MIEGIVGLPGSGKTLLACRMIEKARKEGKRCFANFSSPDGRWERVVWDEIVKLDNCFVLLDEAHMWFPSRDWNKQTQDVLGIFQQHRKLGMDLVWIAQHENRIDVALRELTAYLHWCRKIGPFIIQLTHEACGKNKTKTQVWLASDYYGDYWTEERVLGRNERTDAPIVGVEPNFARYVDEFGHVRIVRRERNAEPSGEQPERCYYVSPWSHRMVEFDK